MASSVGKEAGWAAGANSESMAGAAGVAATSRPSMAASAFSVGLGAVPHCKTTMTATTGCFTVVGLWTGFEVLVI